MLFIHNFLCLFQNSLMSPSSSNKSSASNSGSTSSTETNSVNNANEPSVTTRPRAGSDSSNNSNTSKGPVSKVMDLFRNRSHSAVSAEDKRKAVSRHLYWFI